jgi:hypothetical protein
LLAIAVLSFISLCFLFVSSISFSLIVGTRVLSCPSGI